MILAADVGGTKTHLALYRPGAEPRRPLVDRKVSSRDYTSLSSLIMDFLRESPGEIDRAILGIAGPVLENRVTTTNLPWEVSADSIARDLNARQVWLLNDLEATAWGLSTLGLEDLEVLQGGRPGLGNRALIAAGTGLGEAALVWDGARWLPSASEGGHTDFGPVDDFEDELLRYLRARYGHVSYERVLSGPGLADLYRFCAETGRETANPDVARRFAEAVDPAPVVTEAGLSGECPRARLALARFVRIYGAEAGNLALKTLATGGLFVAGGIAPRILPLLREGDFVERFTDKGRMTHVLRRIPVVVVRRPETALWGAAAYAQSRSLAEAL